MTLAGRPTLRAVVLVAAALAIGFLCGLADTTAAPPLPSGGAGAGGAGAAGYFASNFGTCAAVVVCGELLARLDRGSSPRALLSALATAAIAVLLGLAVIVFGEVLGRYRLEVLPWLVHLPLEIAAIAIALARYLAALQGLPRPSLRRVLGQLAVLLVAAAVVEAFLVPLEV